jgi:hypothetical protein
MRVFVEGGGDQRRTQTACRKAFHLLFEKLLGDRPSPGITACGGRDEAHRDFLRSLDRDPATHAVLLVDSEGPVAAGNTPTAHLRDRDGWAEPMPGEQVHLMVQCMEAWFLADKAALAGYYGEGFRESALPRNPNIEDVPKGDLMVGLDRAASGTSKGSYHKTRHGFAVLERINPTAVRQRSPHAERLFRFLLDRLA